MLAWACRQWRVTGIPQTHIHMLSLPHSRCVYYLLIADCTLTHSLSHSLTHSLTHSLKTYLTHSLNHHRQGGYLMSMGEVLGAAGVPLLLFALGRNSSQLDAQCSSSHLSLDSEECDFVRCVRRTNESQSVHPSVYSPIDHLHRRTHTRARTHTPP